MANKKERIIALDYFRGICILVVLFSHFAYFKTPFTLLSGEGRLWTSAAEMFFLLSGLTLGIVRSEAVVKNFWATTKKMWRRAYDLYVINILIVLVSLFMALKLTASGHSYYMPGSLPTEGALALLKDVLLLKYSFGWANFLMFYAVFMLVAPLALRTLRSKAWLSVPLVSLLIFSLSGLQSVHQNPYMYFLVWQAYFFIGLTLARHRLNILNRFWGMKSLARQSLSVSIVSLTIVILTLSAFLSFRTPVLLAKLQSASYVPAFIKNLANYLVVDQESINQWLQNARSGLLRPVVSLLVLAAGYLIYQQYKQFLLKYTGNFVITMGKNTLQVFVAQALVIPLLAIGPIANNSLFINLAMTSVLLGSMWLVCQRKALIGVGRLALRGTYFKLSTLYFYNFRDFTDEA